MNPLRISLLPFLSCACFLCFGCPMTKYVNKMDVLRAATVQIQVTESGSDKPDQFCSDFALNPEQVKEYFSLAHEVESQVLHRAYQWLPCYVRGTIKSDTLQGTFEIRAGQTAVVTGFFPEPLLLGCCECGHLFGEEE